MIGRNAIYKIDARDAYKRLSRQFTSGFGRLFSSKYKKLIADIRINRKDGKKPSYMVAMELMSELSVYHAKLEGFQQIEAPIKSDLGAAYKGVDSDWQIILKQINRLKELFSSGASFSKLETFSNVEYENNRSEWGVC